MSHMCLSVNHASVTTEQTSTLKSNFAQLLVPHRHETRVQLLPPHITSNSYVSLLSIWTAIVSQSQMISVLCCCSNT